MSLTQKEFPMHQMHSLEDDLICPITLELPYDPVMCEDGRVYERRAILQHFKRMIACELEIVSPMTKNPMGQTLLPAFQHKSTIESLVNMEVITGELAQSWKHRRQLERAKEQLLRQAEQGDVLAMHRAAHNYYHGNNGFPEDDKLAYAWFERAHELGYSASTAYFGEMIARGEGSDAGKDERGGLCCIKLAAGKGSAVGAYLYGFALADGTYGLKKDKTEAIYWLERSLSGICPFQDMTEEAEEEARLKLNTLQTDEPTELPVIRNNSIATNNISVA